MTLELKPVRTPFDIESMRVIRNKCRAFMTRSTEKISYHEQALWWAKLVDGDPNFETWQPFLAIEGYVLGYGILWHGERVQARQHPESLNAWWLTGGLLLQFRGQGHGRRLFELLIERAGVPCWLEVRTDNLKARALYHALGFKPVETTPEVLTMQKET